MFPVADDLPDLSKFEVKPKSKQTGGDETVARVVDDELSKLGWSENARLSLLGDLGRENGWNRDVIFGGHSDPDNKEFNRGIISWQKDRRVNLDNYLKKQGVYGRRNDDELRGMVRFLDEEMKSSPEWQGIHKAVRNPQISTYDASENLRKYIKYVPAAPYNSPDDQFRVKNNRVWAEKAKSLGLGKLPDLSAFEVNGERLPDLSEFEVKSGVA
ncbi:MAG TPA: phage tail tip lysozyme, partial [Pyrinomonadaceae bacterium]